MEIGLYSFGETRVNPSTGRPLHVRQRLTHLLEEIETADQVGLDVFGVGEHHRADYTVSSPMTVLAAAAARTRRIRLTSAVTVLGSDDPVRVFQAFATLDLLSGGRAEIMAGRGSFTESFPLFGYDLAHYDELFAEKLDLLLNLRDSEVVRWSGRHRPPIEGRPVYPRPLQDPLPVWLAVGGNPGSVNRAGSLGLPMALAIIAGAPARFRPMAELYRRTLAEAGHDPEGTPLSLNVHGFLSTDGQRARETALPAFQETMNRIGRERGWPPMDRSHLERDAAPGGALLVGEPEEVVERILEQHTLFRHRRLLIQLTVGPLPHSQVLEAIELLGTEVAPLVRRELGAPGDPSGGVRRDPNGASPDGPRVGRTRDPEEQGDPP